MSSTDSIEIMLNFFALVGIVVIGVVAPALLTLGIVYGRSGYRAFSIGAIFPATLSFAVAVCVVVVGVVDNDWDEFLDSDGLVSSLTLAVLAIGGCGLLGAAVPQFLNVAAAKTPPVDSDARRSLQFSLGSLLALTGGCSVVFAVLFALPPAIATGLLTPLGLMIPIALVELLIYGQPKFRPALIGAVFAATPLFCVSVVIFVVASIDEGWLRTLRYDGLSSGLRLASGMTWLAMPIVGGLCQLVWALSLKDRSG